MTTCVSRRAWGVVPLLAVVLIVGVSGSAGAAQEPARLEEVGKKVTDDVGKVAKVSGAAANGRFVAVLEENHSLRAGQLEIAIMLSRLHRDHQLRHIGLEGYGEGTAFDAEWIRKLGNDPNKLPVATQLLKEGEINAVEFAALMYSDLKVHPIEDSALYQKVKLTKAANTAPLEYLIAIAARTVKDEDAVKAFKRLEQRLEEKKPLSSDPVDLLLNADPWVKERYKKLFSRDDLLDITDEIKLLAELKEKAAATGAVKELDSPTKEGMDLLIQFMEGADKRSDSMTQAALAVARTVQGPIAMVIGAGHTKQVCASLDAARQPYIVLSTNSLRDTGRYSSLAPSLYDRKMRRQSIDPGALGAVLNKKEKPASVVSETWFQAKTELYLFTAKLGGAGGGGKPPGGGPPPGFAPGDFNGRRVRIDPRSFEWVGDEFIFKATLFTDDTRRGTDIWVRVDPKSAGKAIKDRGIDEYLKAALQEVRDGGTRIEEKVKLAEVAQVEAYKQARSAEDSEAAAKDKMKKSEEAATKAREAEAAQKEEAERLAKEAAKEAEEAKKQHEEAEKKAIEAEAKVKDAEKVVKEVRESEAKTKADDAPVAQVSATARARFASTKEEALAMPALRN